MIQRKSYEFAVKIVGLCQKLREDKKEFVLTKQLLRSGTSIGANVEEAIGAQTEKDFFAKMTIAYKEARETNYWIRLLRDANLLDMDSANKALEDTMELMRIIGSIQRTMRRKMGS